MNITKFFSCYKKESISTEEIQNAVTDIITAPGGNNCIMILFDYLKDSKLLPKRYSDKEHLKEVYSLDVKEKF